MTKKQAIKFIKILHKMEEKESRGGLFTTDTVMTISAIRKQFLKIYWSTK